MANRTLFNRFSWQWLTIDRLVTAVLFLGIFAMAARLPFDTDSWWHLQSGRWIVENGAIPRADPFSFTRFGQPWIDHGWLAQIGWFLAFDWFGYAGPVVLLAALVTAAFYFAWLQCRDENRWLQAFILVLAAAAAGVIWAARPQMVSFLLASVVAFLLYRFKQASRPDRFLPESPGMKKTPVKPVRSAKIIWWLPPVMLLWVNIHGGFAIGFILIVAYLFGETGNIILKSGSPGIGWRGLRTLALALLVSIAVIPLNPNGFQMLTYPFRTVGIEILQEFIAEWQSPDFHEFFLHPFIWLLLAALTAFGLSGKRADFTDLTLVALFAYMSLLAVRNIPLFALVTAPVIVRYSAAAWERWQGTAEPAPAPPPIKPGLLAAMNWLILLLLVGMALVRVAQSSSPVANEADQIDSLPVAAVNYLREAAPPGPIFNNYNWGGYLIWELPQYPVFVDGRTDLFDDDFLRQYLSIYLGEDGWQEKLDSHGVNLILIEPDTQLARQLLRQPEWEQEYGDDVAVIFTRRE